MWGNFNKFRDDVQKKRVTFGYIPAYKDLEQNGGGRRKVKVMAKDLTTVGAAKGVEEEGEEEEEGNL